MKKKVKIIGLTGGAGSGKTEAAHFFSELDLKIISLDDLGKELFFKEKSISEEIAEVFGSSVLNSRGKVSKEKLRKFVFSHREYMNKLDSIYYSHFDATIKNMVDEFKLKNEKNNKMMLIDGAILHHASLDKYTDIDILVKCDETIQLKRLSKRMKIDEEEAKTLITLQKSKMPLDKDVDYIIKNDGSLDELKDKVKKIYLEISG